MLKFLLLSVLLLSFINEVVPTCPNNTYPVPSDLGSTWNCVYFGTNPLSYANAEYVCETMEGHLISIPNGFLNTYLGALIEAISSVDLFWVGVTNLLGGQWRNVDDGSNTTYMDWASGQPNNFTNNRFCVTIDDNGLWYTQYCNETFSFVCGVPGIGGGGSPAPAVSTKITTLPVDSQTITRDVSSSKTFNNRPSRSLKCRSYIPFSFDVSRKLTTRKFTQVKNFIFGSFIQKIFPNNIQPAPFSSYGETNYPIRRLKHFLQVLAHVAVTKDHRNDEGSDFTKSLAYFVAQGVTNYGDGLPVNTVVFAGSVLEDSKVSLAQYYVNQLGVNDNTVTVVLVNRNIDQTNYKKVNGLNIVTWSDPATLISSLKSNMRCA